MSKFILLNPLTPSDFSLDTFEEIIEALDEFGCKYIYSHNCNGETVLFATATTMEALEAMVSSVELPGVVLEYKSVFDQAVIVS